MITVLTTKQQPPRLGEAAALRKTAPLSTMEENHVNMQRKKLSELTITDDFMFGEVMRDKKLAKGLIERVLGDRVGKISRVVPQKVINPYLHTVDNEVLKHIVEVSIS